MKRKLASVKPAAIMLEIFSFSGRKKKKDQIPLETEPEVLT